MKGWFLFLFLGLFFFICGVSFAAGLSEWEFIGADESVVPVKYARINTAENEVAGLYYDALAASKGINPASVIPYGKLRYVSYDEKVIINGNAYVRSKNGMWLRASPVEIPPLSNGVRFKVEDPHPLGWVLSDTIPSPFSGTRPDDDLGVLRQGTVLSYSEVEEVYGNRWYRVAENKWVEHNHFAALDLSAYSVFPKKEGRWIMIDLTQQVLTAFEGERPVFATVIASGADHLTDPGVFSIREKHVTDHMFGALKADRSDFFYLEDVPYTMYFDAEKAIHGIYWPAVLGFPQSHGCINMLIGDAAWLFGWAEEGDPVWVVE